MFAVPAAVGVPLATALADDGYYWCDSDSCSSSVYTDDGGVYNNTTNFGDGWNDSYDW